MAEYTLPPEMDAFAEAAGAAAMGPFQELTQSKSDRESL